MAPKLGLIAGGGSLPAKLVATCQSQGRPVVVLALRGHADPAGLSGCPVEWIRLGQAGRGIDWLKAQGAQEVVMAGPVRRPTLLDLRPDARTLRFFARIGLKALGDDGVLRAVITELESEGFRILGLHEILEDVLAPAGVWGRVVPDDTALADIARGLSILRAIGPLDIGQSIIIQQGIVLGVEAIEGTDALIARCAGLHRAGPGGVLVKASKPGQDQRVDLPTIGPETLRRARAAGVRGIAVEAGATVVVARDLLIEQADAAGLFLIGMTS